MLKWPRCKKNPNKVNISIFRKVLESLAKGGWQTLQILTCISVGVLDERQVCKRSSTVFDETVKHFSITDIRINSCFWFSQCEILNIQVEIYDCVQAIVCWTLSAYYNYTANQEKHQDQLIYSFLNFHSWNIYMCVENTQNTLQPMKTSLLYINIY